MMAGAQDLGGGMRSSAQMQAGFGALSAYSAGSMDPYNDVTNYGMASAAAGPNARMQTTRALNDMPLADAMDIRRKITHGMSFDKSLPDGMRGMGVTETMFNSLWGTKFGGAGLAAGLSESQLAPEAAGLIHTWRATGDLGKTISGAVDKNHSAGDIKRILANALKSQRRPGMTTYDQALGAIDTVLSADDIAFSAKGGIGDPAAGGLAAQVKKQEDQKKITAEVGTAKAGGEILAGATREVQAFADGLEKAARDQTAAVGSILELAKRAKSLGVAFAKVKPLGDHPVAENARRTVPAGNKKKK